MIRPEFSSLAKSCEKKIRKKVKKITFFKSKNYKEEQNLVKNKYAILLVLPVEEISL